MKCKGKFKFKELKSKDGGSFINAKGDKIDYDASYALKVDEVTEAGIYERVFKVKTDSELIQALSQLKPYQDFVLEFNVDIYSTRIVLTPVAISN